MVVIIIKNQIFSFSYSRDNQNHHFDGSRLTPFGEPPSPRAAHVATAVGTMVVIQVIMTLLPQTLNASSPQTLNVDTEKIYEESIVFIS